MQQVSKKALMPLSSRSDRARCLHTLKSCLMGAFLRSLDDALVSESLSDSWCGRTKPDPAGELLEKSAAASSLFACSTEICTSARPSMSCPGGTSGKSFSSRCRRSR